MRGAAVASLGLTALALAGCDRAFGLERNIDAADPRVCFGKSGNDGAGLASICVGDIDLADELTVPQMVDTDNGAPDPCTLVWPQSDVNQKDLCVIAARVVHVTGTIAHGNRPLVLLATHALDVTGDLDGASHRGGSNGPARDYAGCPTGFDAGMQGDDGGGGGAGGSFGTMGGDGGDGPTTGRGGAARAVQTLVSVRGGCTAARGGSGASAPTGGNGGSSGGALYLIAGDTLTVSGRINASGASGHGALGQSQGKGGGGGGGGSGGLIGLDAPQVVISDGARLVANGGGGGGGGGTSAGDDGAEADILAGAFPYAAAGGGPGGTVGTAGGAGASTTGALPGAKVTSTTGGAGGGGGGAGVIAIFTQQLERGAAELSPEPR